MMTFAQMNAAWHLGDFTFHRPHGEAAPFIKGQSQDQNFICTQRHVQQSKE